MACPEYGNLFATYTLALMRYRKAMESLKYASPYNIEQLNEVVDCARKGTVAARVAVQNHRESHDCLEDTMADLSEPFELSNVRQRPRTGSQTTDE